jgi:MFS family permease
MPAGSSTARAAIAGRDREAAAAAVSRTTLTPLLVAAGILLAGNGLQVTLVSVRANLEGFSPLVIGLLGTAYYMGFIGGCLLAARMILRSGHIRVFAALAALAAIATITLVLLVDPLVWMATRAATGFAFAGLSTVIESWLNESAGNVARGRILSRYRIIDLCAVTGAQFLLPAVGADGFALFAIVSILFCAAVLPVALSTQHDPSPPASPSLRIGRVFQISPLACMGCVTIGLTTAAFRTIGPIYAQDLGLDITGVAAFMSAGILGGALLVYPLGWLSDRLDRRLVLVIATAGAALAGLQLTLTAGGAVWLAYLGAFLFGAFALPLYSLSAAHANDHAPPDASSSCPPA